MRRRRAAAGVGAIVLLVGIVAAFALASLTSSDPTPRVGIVERADATADAPDATPAAAAFQVGETHSRSRITQDLIDRTPLPGGGFELVIEATLDSNAVCHVLLLQCVVEPEPAPANMTLQSVECLSPGWVNIDITIPFVGPVNVCARFDHNRAGLDQKFRFTYTTPLETGTVSETVRFFRFPEELFFIRAQDTITIDLPNAADVLEECPDLAEIGTQLTCSVRVEVQPGSVVPNATVVRTSPPELANSTLGSDQPGWTCIINTCTFDGGTLPEGVYTFTATSDVVGPVGDVEDCSSINDGATPIADDCDLVTIYAASDTFANLEMGADRETATPGSEIVWTVTFTNDGPNPLEGGARLVNPNPNLVTNLSIRHVGGPGAWTCGEQPGELTCDLAAGETLPVGATSVFEVRGIVVQSAANGDVIVSEVEMTYANDPFGPEFPLRDGTTVRVVLLEPTFTG